jgi:hypothetical protein
VKNIGAVVMFLCLGLQIVGCGGAKASREPIFKVSGKILYKGKPVEGANVTFMCAEKNRSAFGRTDESGAFKLTTFVSNDGAVPGKHVIVVTSLESVDSTPVAEIGTQEYVPPTNNKSTDPVPPKNAIPAKYADIKKTDLFAVVTEGDNPEMILELKD